jgi:ribonuclease T1
MMSQEPSGGNQRNLGCLGLIVLLIIGAVLIALGGDARTVTSQLLEIGTGSEVVRQVEERVDDLGPPRASQSGLPVILYEDLPPEAHDTLTLIEQDGPFPYDRDGIVFENREGILPDEDYGYYHEYTVITPGENDRGARRIVTGEDGEFYYTDDHYDSFSEVAF